MLSTLVSIWKTLTCSPISRPIRHADACSSELGGSMNDVECTIVSLLWWWRSELYADSPTPTDLCPPSIGTSVTLT